MDSKIRRLQIKIETFSKILDNIKNLSNSSTTKVGCIALRKDFSKIASFGYNGSYSGANENEETGTVDDYRNLDHLEIFKQCNITNGSISVLLDDYHLIKD